MLSRWQKRVINLALAAFLLSGAWGLGRGVVSVLAPAIAFAAPAPLASVESYAAQSGVSPLEPGDRIECATTATEVFAKRPSRHGYCFQVDVASNTEAIHVSLGPNAEVGVSMPYGVGGFGIGKCENGPSVYGGTISCISDSGGQYLYIEEY